MANWGSKSSVDSVHCSWTSQPEMYPVPRAGVVGGVTSSGLGAGVVASTGSLTGDTLLEKSRAWTANVYVVSGSSSGKICDVFWVSVITCVPFRCTWYQIFGPLSVADHMSATWVGPTPVTETRGVVGGTVSAVVVAVTKLLGCDQLFAASTA